MSGVHIRSQYRRSRLRRSCTMRRTPQKARETTSFFSTGRNGRLTDLRPADIPLPLLRQSGSRLQPGERNARRSCLDLSYSGKQLVLRREAHQLRRPVNTQFLHHAGAVVVHGLRTDEQEVGDLRVGLPLDDQLKDLPLAVGQPLEGIVGQRPGALVRLGQGPARMWPEIRLTRLERADPRDQL